MVSKPLFLIQRSLVYVTQLVGPLDMMLPLRLDFLVSSDKPDVCSRIGEKKSARLAFGPGRRENPVHA